MIFLQNTSTAQNEIPSACECLTFVYACTGQPATALLGGTVTIVCGSDTRDYTINSGTIGGAVTLCDPSNIFTCLGSLETPSLCISEGNWEVCSVDECTVTVDQTLTVEPRINGTLLGYGEYHVPGQSGEILCEGRNYTGPLNTEAGATDLFFCPGDQLILDLEDLDIPPTSRMCLYVNVYDTDWELLDGATFFHSDVTNGTVNVTGVFDDLESGQVYILSMLLKCCSGDDCFNSNVYRYAYVNLRGMFGYEPYATGLVGSSGFVPSTSLPGSQLGPPDCTTIPGVCINAITFFGNDVVNTEDVDVDFELVRVDCTTGVLFGPVLHSGTVPGDDPFTTGTMLIQGVSLGCRCYRLDLTYNDGCTENPVTDSYFFKEGPDCFTPNDPPVDKLVRPDTGEIGFGIKANPVRDGRLVFEQFGETNSQSGELELTVHDAIGHKVLSQKLPANGRLFTVLFRAAPGIYFYSALLDGRTFTGKFVKQ